MQRRRRDAPGYLPTYRDPDLDRLLTRGSRLMIGHARVCHTCLRCRRAAEAAAAINRGDPWP
jgi:hypothetical protein